MIDERFLHPLSVFENGRMKVYVAFRKRNHMIPCTTRRMKSMRKQFHRSYRRMVAAAVAITSQPSRRWFSLGEVS